jgi:hypothetical protein
MSQQLSPYGLVGTIGTWAKENVFSSRKSICANRLAQHTGLMVGVHLHRSEIEVEAPLHPVPNAIIQWTPGAALAFNRGVNCRRNRVTMRIRLRTVVGSSKDPNLTEAP